MKKLIGIMMILGLAIGADAQTSKSKVKTKHTKVKHKSPSVAEQQLAPSVSGQGSRSMTIGSGALPSGTIVVYDSTTSSDFHYNPYRKFTPGESVPDEPAPGLENAGRERNRLPNTDKLREPRK